MSEILSNIVVEQTSINFSPDTNNINITPEAIQLNVFTGAAPGAGQSSNGELLYNNTNLIDGVPFTSYANGNLTLGNVGNIKINGGVNGYVLQTDGLGNLDWTAMSGGGGNGSPGGSNTQIQYNDNGSFGGQTGFTFNEVTGNVAIPGSLAVTGTISGTLSTAAQPNITSVGTLTSLAVTGNVTAGNMYANSGTIGASLLTGTLTTNAQPNITSVGTLTSLSVTGNINAGNIDGGNLINANYVTGTLTTNAQPNITSVGSLTGLTVGGNGINTTQIRTTSFKIALGFEAGLSNQSNYAIAVGTDTGYVNQSANAIAIGYRAGYDTQGANSIAIGAFAGNSFQPANTIILNATGTALNIPVNQSDRFYVKPIRNVTNNNFVLYDSANGEVTYSNTIPTLSSLTVSGNISTSNLSATGTTTLASTYVKPIQESVTVVGTAAGASYNYDLINQAVVYNTANANANLTLNFRGNASVTANTFISDANSVVATFLLTNGGTAYGITGVNIDGSARTIRWAGNTVPTTYQNTIMSYTFNLIKTASNTYTVMGSATRYG